MCEWDRSSSIYPIVGTLLTGSTAPALGRSQGGDWIQIEYAGAPNNKGWVYSPLVEVSPGILKVVEPPPTPIPPATSTIDPTLAAQFNIVPTNTRLPTFTPPPSLTVPVSIPTSPDARLRNSVPLATVIIALAISGKHWFSAFDISSAIARMKFPRRLLFPSFFHVDVWGHGVGILLAFAIPCPRSAANRFHSNGHRDAARGDRCLVS